MADEELTVRASLEDDLTRPLERTREKIEDVGDEVRTLDRRASRGAASVDNLARKGVGLARVAGRTLTSALRLGAIGIAGLTAAAVAGGAKLVSLGSDAAETASKFATVFADNAGAVDKWVKATNAAYGITTKDLQDVTSRFGVFGKAAGIAAGDLPEFSTQLAQAGLDLSSFYNVDPEEAFLALSSGLAGEAEPLRRFGIFLSDAAMKAEAATMGLTGELTEAQKVAVRQRLILKNLGDANGDLARTSDSVANKWRALKGRGVELATQIGTALLPVVGRLLTYLDGKLAPVVAKLTEQAPNLAAALGDLFDTGDAQGLAEVIDNIFGNTGRWVAPILTAADVVRGLWQAFTGGGGAAEAVALIDDTVGAGGRLVEWFDKAREVARDLATIWTDLLNPAIEDLGPVAGAVLSPLTLLDDAIGFIADHAAELRGPLKAILAIYVAWKAATMAAAAGQVAFTAAVKGYQIATKLAAAAQWVWNAALAANPIGLIVLAIAAVVAGVVLAYQKVGWFRDAVDAVGRAGRTALGWIVDKLRMVWDKTESVRRVWWELQKLQFRLVIGALRIIGAVLGWVWDKTEPVRSALADVAANKLAALRDAITWVIVNLVDLWNKSEPVRSLLADIGAIALTTLKDAVAWVILKAVDLWDKTEPVRDLLAEIGGFTWETLKDAVGWVVDKLQWIIDNASKITGPLNAIADTAGGVVGAGVRLIGGGDTPRPRARGARRGGHGAPRALASTVARHTAIDRAVPGRRTITSGYRSWALGSANSDHVTGRALDLTGSNLNTYAHRARQAGAYAEHHGSGAGRHLHVAYGDTPRPRARMADGYGDGGGGTLIVLEEGAVQVNNPSSDIDLERAIAAGIARHDRERRERGPRTR